MELIVASMPMMSITAHLAAADAFTGEIPEMALLFTFEFS